MLKGGVKTLQTDWPEVVSQAVPQAAVTTKSIGNVATKSELGEA